MNDLPALLGNRPIFESKIQISRPSLAPYREFAETIREILESGVLTKGPRLREFEEMVAEQLGVKDAVAVSSCSAGLMLSYQAFGLTGDVVVPSFTFMATVGALRWAGLRPIFADVNRNTFNLDPRAAAAAITPNTTAIVAVHNFGNPAEIAELQTLADRHGIRLIFDAAQAFGSCYEGSAVGRQGDAQVFSLSPTKLLVAGEGGIVATNDHLIAEQIRVAREYGNAGDYDCAFPSINARLPEFNALLGQHGLKYLEGAARRRNDIANLYRERLGRLPGVTFQEVRERDRSSYNYFAIVIDPEAFGLARDDLAAVLAAENIETRKYYDPPVHRQSAYRCYAPANYALHNTEFVASRILALPLWSHMETPLASNICLAIERARQFAAAIKAIRNQPTISLGLRN